ncbi:hypothetical protein [Aeromonas veronii]|uniref:hypothetical protein n=1 Tax=Aeromonas veronii TaxID=654 RepID=UPI0029A6D3FA|nr:hypothetical protein [Aeromonas veronii]
MSLSEDIIEFNNDTLRRSLEVDTYSRPEHSIGFNDDGEALYSVNGWEMTASQRDSILNSDNVEYNQYTNEVDTFDLTENPIAYNDFDKPIYSFNGMGLTVAQHKALFGESDETCTQEQRENFDTHLAMAENDESNHHPVYSKLNTINKVSGDVGQFYSDALFNDDHEAMASVSNATGMERDEINSYAYSVLADISNEIGADYGQLVETLEQDISYIKSTGSEVGYKIIDSAIKRAFNGDYHGAMSIWDGYRKIINKNK